MPFVQLSQVTGDWQGRQVAFRDDRLVVSVRPGAPVQQTLNSVAATLEHHLMTSPVVTHPPDRPWAIFKFGPVPNAATRIPQLATQIAANDNVLYAEPSFIGSGSLTPSASETHYPDQKWPGVIKLEDAWTLTTGDAAVLLAVIDSGISISAAGALDHEDLKGPRYIINSGMALQDYVESDLIPQDDETSGHGTHVTGILSAAGDNNVGIAGVNWVSPVYIARVLDSGNNFGTDDLKVVLDALMKYAEASGNDRVVVNMSLGVSVDTKHLKEMCGDAQGWTKGKILICCAPHVRGLSRTDVDFPSAYAANYDFVVSVGATNGTVDPLTDTVAGSLVLDNYDAVTIFAPGVAVYSTLPTQARGTTGEAAETGYGERSGTSFACPMVTGVASLMWSKNAALTAAQVIACLETTADEITYDRNIRDADGHIILTVKTSHRRLNASAAVASALWHVEPENSHLVFTDVVAGSSEAQQVVFDITCGHRLNFNITPGPSGALPGTLTVAPASGAYDPATGGTFALSTVTYAPAAAGETATGDFTITCAETAQVWTIYVTANAAPAETAAAVLIADRSGSMSLPSGIDMLTRMDVLRSAAGILVDTMRVNDALGIVGFSTDVDIPWPLADITEATNRDTIKAAVNAMAPGGATSIGGGVESGATVLSPATQTHRGLMVLTDGQENTPPMIADVLGSVSVPVYAIGMGTAQALQPAALDALTVSTGGYLLLTDTLDDTARYRVAKYVLQMLAGITDTSMVLDPAGMLRARQEISIPFDLCEEDRECDVVLMTTVPAWVRLTIVGPDGEDVKVRREVVNGAGAELLSRRFPLPLGDVHAGTWRAILSIVSGEAEVALAELAAARDAAPALPYHLVVMSKSNIMMRCRAQATSIRPGATVTLRSVVTRRGLPFDKHVSVEATVSTHDQDTKVTLARTAPGVFEGTFTATQSGVYACLVRATGLIENGQRFTREQTVTAHTWSFDAPPGSDERDRAREKNPPS